MRCHVAAAICTYLSTYLVGLFENIHVVTCKPKSTTNYVHSFSFVCFSFSFFFLF
ncbi:uncharacterized protein GGS25DRAFT_473931 [Hypoxylon fragiforme]|uniref:uncharacterized protein n=1 Tax=Hypoxylon fragiforme TaxID=63214 RepID=UPI0020C6BF16|nr:uncharacterized protein GGS25DRAFT_473931 [Hypoxylon fragiforme]KAI2612145.1 hypothetical protein GGS25DRAFT_473931 [Hypoxylon fragiforme]